MYTWYMDRPNFKKEIANLLLAHPVVAILGPRQCGKTTLARQYFAQHKVPGKNYFDLEDPVDEQRLSQAKMALEDLTGLIVIDEIQRAPELFKLLRALVDRSNNKQRYLILGSASRELIKQSSESLAGRIHYLELTPFQLSEIGVEKRVKHWLRGSFPRSYLARRNIDSRSWRDAFIRTFLEQDIPALGINIPTAHLRRFWMMLAHYHGQIFNSSELSRPLQISDVTVKKYLDILTGTFMIRQLQPWLENIKKRKIKKPKIYFRDSGIFHRLLLLPSDESIETHPKLGASWEGYALEEIIRYYGATPEQVYFWGIHAQCELDLLMFTQGKKLGFEIKYQDAPKLTNSMLQAIKFLALDRLIVVYPGSKSYRLDASIEVVPIQQIIKMKR